MIRFYKKLCKQKATKFCKREIGLKHKLEYAQKEWQKFTNNDSLQQLVGCLKKKS